MRQEEEKALCKYLNDESAEDDKEGGQEQDDKEGGQEPSEPRIVMTKRMLIMAVLYGREGEKGRL